MPNRSFSAKDLGFDFFDVDDTPVKRDPAREAYHALRRGSVFMVGKSKWTVFQGDGGIQVYVLKHGSKGKKAYTALMVGGNEVEVYEIDGMNNRKGLVAKGPFKATGEFVRMS
jgi:L-ascorbate metabolism protein UlaG (beta-lactamase superfamily)